jgi:23S rRNA (adenine2503-C2)-methyltransferase
MKSEAGIDIRTLSLAEIEKFFQENNEKAFRAKQVYEWLWKKSCRSFDEMTNLSRETRQLMQENFIFPVLITEREITSSDRTIKTLFRLPDDLLVEGVLIPEADRTTACISSQAGCPLACAFCATGFLGFKRNLSFTEIFDQVTDINRQSIRTFHTPLSNIVFMGMGEPLLNYGEVKKAMEKITSPGGLGMSPQRITVSSVGIPSVIRRMAEEGVRFHFALSLHAADNEKRSIIIPLNKKYPIGELTEALTYYHDTTKKRITIEYLLFDRFNDTLTDASDLARFCKNFPVKINLIEYNPVEGSVYRRSDPARLNAFKEFLEKKNLVVNIRRSRGGDIQAACGQLATNAKFHAS